MAIVFDPASTLSPNIKFDDPGRGVRLAQADAAGIGGIVHFLDSLNGTLAPTQISQSGGIPDGVSRFTGRAANFTGTIFGDTILGDPQSPPFFGTFADTTAAQTTLFGAPRASAVLPIFLPGVGLGAGAAGGGAVGLGAPAQGAADPITQALMAAGGGNQAIGTTGLEALFGNNANAGGVQQQATNSAFATQSGGLGNSDLMQIITRQQSQINQLTQGMGQLSQGINLIMNRLGIA
jgi:hypothetical protein